MTRFGLGLICACAALLGACGFSPAYAPGPADSSDAGAVVRIPEIEGRSGHFLRRELVRAVGFGVPGLSGPAELAVELEESVVRLGYTPDQAASRSDYVGVARWTLSGGDGTVLASGQAREAAGFNYADAAFADVTAQQSAQEKVATQLARSIRNQMLGAIRSPAASGPPGG